MSLLTPAAIQAYFREVAGRLYGRVPIPPFTLFFHPTDALVHFNYAIPDEPVSGDLSVPLAALRRAFQDRGRVPRFEFVEAFAPELRPVLLSAGFVDEPPAYLMTTSPDRLRDAPRIPGFSVRTLTAASADEDLRDGQRVARLAFGVPDPEAATAGDARAFLVGDAASFLGLVDGSPVAIATLLPSAAGLAEVSGVATLPEFRRRGIGAALTAAAVRLAFSRGLGAVVLSAGSEEAGRVYAAVGFAGAGSTLLLRQG